VTDPTARFTSRAGDYAAHRPTYPPGLLALLAREGVLGRGDVVADVGSGTGILTELLLANGNVVHAVEPNEAMAAAAAARLGADPRFHAVAGRAEATTLPDASCDVVTAAQAFHWFDVEAARRELARILRPGGRVALVWNNRRTDTTPFLRVYEDLLQRFALDYKKISAGWADEETIARFFAPGGFEKRVLANRQSFDFDGLRGRLLSSSYAPPAGHPSHEPMLAELRRIFDRHRQDGEVAFDYDVAVYWGVLQSKP
jgi:SAM-dependent methyltransferase